MAAQKQIINFFRFLKEKGVYDNYKMYITDKRFWEKNVSNGITGLLMRQNCCSASDFLHSVPTHMLIQDAFSWKHTIEGYDFWANINDKFKYNI